MGDKTVVSRKEGTKSEMFRRRALASRQKIGGDLQEHEFATAIPSSSVRHPRWEYLDAFGCQALRLPPSSRPVQLKGKGAKVQGDDVPEQVPFRKFTRHIEPAF
jgi:hypothetical protein